MQTLPSDISSSHQTIISQRKEIARLERELAYAQEQIRLMSARYFGRSSEKRSDDKVSAQVLLFPEQKAAEAPAPKTQKIEYTRRERQSVQGKLPEGTRFPEHLPREEQVIDEGEGEVVFEKVTERLAAKGSPFYVKRIVRRVRKSEGSLATPALPPAVIEGTTVDKSFLVYVLMAKYVWHLPLYRQEQILKAQGISISRDTLIRYVIEVASFLKPIYVALGAELFSGNHLFGDETPVLVKKGKHGSGRYTESWYWTFLGEKGCAFFHAPTRAFREVEPLIKSFSGYFQSDGYQVYEKLAATYPEITLVGCWAHARRKFIDAEKGGNAPLASEALRYIRALYRVETRIRDGDIPSSGILKLRQRFSRRILNLFRVWLLKQAQDPALLPKSLYGKAIGYTLKRFEALCRYTENPSLAIDSNAVEREIRPVALGKKNWLFCASEAGAEASAIIYSLIASCRIAGVDPAAYLNDVLDRISEHPASQVVDLVPCNWATTVERQKQAA